MSEVTTEKPTEKALTAEGSFRGEMTKMQGQFAMVLPSHVSPEKFVRVAMTAVIGNPDLLKTDRKLLIQELMKSAADGLIPDGRESAMVLFKGKPKYLPMTGGILKKVRNSGDLKSINPMVAYDNDIFEYWVDENGPHLNHRPVFDRDPGKPKLTYAVALTKDGGVYIEIITEGEMDQIRNVSKAENGPWNGPFEDEMRKKSVIKRISKRLPSSTDLDQVLERDAEITEPKQITEPLRYQTIDVQSAPRIAEKAQEPTPPAEPEPKKEKASKPFNHAPGASNPPPDSQVNVTQNLTKTDEAPASKGPDRKELSMKIYKLCLALQVDVKAKILELSKKAPEALTTSEMADVLTLLEIETANKKEKS